MEFRWSFPREHANATTPRCRHERLVFVRAGEYGGEPGPGALTVGSALRLAELRGYCADDAAWCEDCGALGVVPHVIEGQVIGDRPGNAG